MKNTLRIFLLSILAITIMQTATGSLYKYPEKMRPAVSLEDACKIAHALLKSRGEDKQYYIISVSLFGDEAQSGEGAWNLWHHDTEGNELNIHIPFPNRNVSMNYYPYGDPNGGGKNEMKLKLTAADILEGKLIQTADKK